MPVELRQPEPAAEVGVLGDIRSLPLARDDDAFALELEIGALDGDDADLHGGRKGADRRQLVSGRPVPHGDAAPDLLDDLEIHRAAIGLRDQQVTVYVQYAQYTRYNEAVNRKVPRG